MKNAFDTLKYIILLIREVYTFPSTSKRADELLMNLQGHLVMCVPQVWIVPLIKVYYIQPPQGKSRFSNKNLVEVQLIERRA